MTKKIENGRQESAIILQSGLSLDELTKELGPFMESVTQQLESDDPAMKESAEMFARESVGTMLTKNADTLAVRDRIAELYFAYLALAKRIREGVQQAETMARRQERVAEIIRSNIEAWMLTSWDAKKITGNYREFRISKNPDRVTILNEEEIPAEFFDEVPASKVLNKTRLAEALKANIAKRNTASATLSQEEIAKVFKETEIAGAILETNRTRLDIK